MILESNVWNITKRGYNLLIRFLHSKKKLCAKKESQEVENVKRLQTDRWTTDAGQNVIRIALLNFQLRWANNRKLHQISLQYVVFRKSVRLNEVKSLPLRPAPSLGRWCVTFCLYTMWRTDFHPGSTTWRTQCCHGNWWHWPARLVPHSIGHTEREDNSVINLCPTQHWAECVVFF